MNHLVNSILSGRRVLIQTLYDSYEMFISGDELESFCSMAGESAFALTVAGFLQSEPWP